MTTKKTKSKVSKTTSKKVSKTPQPVSRGVGIRPLGDRVLVRPFTKEEVMEKNSFGIILPEKNNKEKVEQGLVVALGPGKMDGGKLVPIALNVGDVVAFSKYGYEDISRGGVDYYLLKEENILAVLDK